MGLGKVSHYSDSFLITHSIHIVLIGTILDYQKIYSKSYRGTEYSSHRVSKRLKSRRRDTNISKMTISLCKDFGLLHQFRVSSAHKTPTGFLIR